MFEPFLKTPGEELEILIYAFPCYAANTGQISALVNFLLQENDVIRGYLFINAE
jgi:hypothetical protein